MSDKIAFIDLAAQQAGLRSKIDTAIAKVLDHGGYIMGPEVAAFEKQLKDWSRAKKEALMRGDISNLKELAVCGNNTHYSNANKSK